MLRTSRSIQNNRMRGYNSTADMPVATLDPLSLSPSIWLDSTYGLEESAGTPATLSGNVGRWLDKSGNANNAIATGTDGTMVAEGLSMDGSYGIGYSTGLTISKPYTIFLVEKPQTTGMSGIRTIQSNSTNYLISMSNPTSVYLSSGGLSTYQVTDEGTHIAELVAPVSGNFSYLVDGVDKTDSTIASGNWGELGLGNYGQFDEPGYTTIREVFVANLDSTQRTAMREYLANKYSVTLP